MFILDINFQGVGCDTNIKKFPMRQIYLTFAVNYTWLIIGLIYNIAGYRTAASPILMIIMGRLYMTLFSLPIFF